MEEKQHEITFFLHINRKFVNKNYFKSKTLRKTAILLYYFLSFSVEIWNYLQQVEFFAQNGPEFI